MNIGWVSASPLATTGYGTQTKEVVSRLAERHNVVCMGCIGDVIVWGGRQELETPHGAVPVVALGDRQAAPDIINKVYIPEYDLDVLVGFMDAFGIDFLNEARKPAIGYIPIDGPFTEPWKDFVKGFYKVVAYSEYGYKELLKVYPPSRVGYIPHGIDTDTFSPLKRRERNEAREELEEKYGIPPDSVLYVTVAANVGPRKEIPQLMYTFKRFVKRGYDAHLYIHTNAYQPYPRGYDLVRWRSMLGMEDRIHFPRYNPIISPSTDRDLARLYNAADVYVSNSVAEGFGLPIAEALSCGTPVICPDNSAQTELARDHGWITHSLPKHLYFQVPVYVPQLTWYPVPDQSSLLDNFKESYDNPDLRLAYGFAGRKFIVERHGWDVVMEKWFSLFEEIEEDIELLGAAEKNLSA